MRWEKDDGGIKKWKQVVPDLELELAYQQKGIKDGVLVYGVSVDGVIQNFKARVKT